MKHFFLFVALTLIGKITMAQVQTFDLTTFTAPKGWVKKTTPSAIQLTKSDDAKGTYCLITLYKSVPGTNNSKDNFDMAWKTLVKEMVTVKSAPEMQPASSENGWEAQSGYAPFESDGNKGVALLVTSTSGQKMVNIMILTNTDVYQQNMTDFLESVSFKKQAVTPVTPNVNTNPVTKPVNKPVAVSNTNGYGFTTTNFDDGWTSTVQADWVEVTKGNIKVLLHYPKKGTIFPADPDPLIRGAWDILVAPHYSSLRNFKTAYISTYDRPYLGMGYATSNSTGKEVFVVFFRRGDSGWLEFIAPDKNSFIQYFKFDPEKIQWDSNSDLLNPLAAMVNYNKFAITASDFTGTWSSDFSGVQQLYNVYTGDYAGMNLNQSNQTFQFLAGSKYSWSFLAVNGMVGNMKYASEKSAGKFTVLNNWQVHFTDIEGKPKKYNAFFSCIKGARLLKMLDADFPGSGIYLVFGKK